MKVAVCVKRIPDTAESEIKVDDTGKDIIKDKLAFIINEPDNYALEEALILREKSGGTVVLVSIGPKETEEVLRIGLAKGADEAVRIDNAGLAGSDAIVLAGVLAAYFRKEQFDLVFTGCIAQDTQDSQVGPALAQFLGWPHAMYAIRFENKDNEVVVRRELEGGSLEVKRLNRPCVVSFQTGGNAPRYASILGIRQARTKPLERLDIASLGLEQDEVGDTGSKTRLIKLYVPKVSSAAEILQGTVDEKVSKIATIIKEKGLL
ncbi:hypothetical protein CH330_04545 [candidate division WOR-3 bacterium JGI_Cruoil_03_51_56]|uniref:Electron transfer flavoprotein alpha/beta-subunit N-terminal domain-containing protein n=1 Tax=candidate division WOR-3 bacterium JGI_Cruoil_03_51_56 TaxID=1973747 RepID=A0A235BUH0_UNCW3|nr:MAG: hypothetical protein CH330_04545 [candidate division WOR-3 bacterium JGI_Cruoil_03_51_56]